MQKPRVALIRGGDGIRFENSIKGGANILSALSEANGFNLLDIWVSKEGAWHLRGMETTLQKSLEGVDFVINSLSGSSFLTTQRALEMYSIPHLGPKRLSALFSMNRQVLRRFLEEERERVPRSFLINADERIDENIKRVFKEFLQPVILSPISSREFVEPQFAYGFQEIKAKTKDLFNLGSKILIEEGPAGKIVSCLVMNNFRDEDIYTSIVMDNTLEKETPAFSVPSIISKELKDKIANTSKKIHRKLFFEGYARYDFLVRADNAFLLKIEPMPFLDDASGFFEALSSIGCSPKFFFENLVLGNAFVKI